LATASHRARGLGKDVPELLVGVVAEATPRRHSSEEESLGAPHVPDARHEALVEKGIP
jgi:hypothetical protein